MAIATSTALMAASAAASAAGTMSSISAANDAADTAAAQGRVAAGNAAYKGYLQKELNQLESANVARQTDSEVQKIRAAAITFRGTQTAAAAASGVIIGDGSAQAAIDHTTQLADSDILATMYAGVNKQIALQTGGRFAVRDATNQAGALLSDAAARATSYKNQATGSLLSGIGTIGSMAMKSGFLPTTIGAAAAPTTEEA